MVVEGLQASVSNRSGEPTHGPGLVPQWSKNLTHRILAGQTWYGTSKPTGFTTIAWTHRFQLHVLYFRVWNVWSDVDILLLVAKY